MNIQTLIISVGSVVNSLIAIMAALAVVVFFWGLVKFIFTAGDPESHKEGKNRMVWGIIALFVMVSVWGIIGFVASDLGVSRWWEGGLPAPSAISTTPTAIPGPTSPILPLGPSPCSSADCSNPSTAG